MVLSDSTEGQRRVDIASNIPQDGTMRHLAMLPTKHLYTLGDNKQEVRAIWTEIMAVKDIAP